MKNETVKKGRVERHYEKSLSKLEILIFLLLFISLLYLSMRIGANLAFGGFNKVYSGYPNTEYEDLEKELSNIIVDNRYIDMERLSDKSIEYTQTFSKSNSYPEETWEIVLKNNDIELHSTIAKSSDNTLQVKSWRNNTKSSFNLYRTIIMIGVIILCIIIVTVIWTIILLLYLFLLEKLVDIERKHIARKAKSTVSNSKGDNS